MKRYYEKEVKTEPIFVWLISAIFNTILPFMFGSLYIMFDFNAWFIMFAGVPLLIGIERGEKRKIRVYIK